MTLSGLDCGMSIPMTELNIYLNNFSGEFTGNFVVVFLFFEFFIFFVCRVYSIHLFSNWIDCGIYVGVRWTDTQLPNNTELHTFLSRFP